MRILLTFVWTACFGFFAFTQDTKLIQPLQVKLNPIQENSSCLPNKDYGKNLTATQIAAVNQAYNVPSPHTFGTMIGINDGGLIFRSFQNATTNPIAQLTTSFRNFHTMDEDFDNSLTNYDQNIKPKDTWPEGTPGYMWYTKYLYNLYKNTHGFGNIAASTEILQYGPLSWKDKIWKENDWSNSGPSGIAAAFQNYTQVFIDNMAPANGSGSNLLVSYYQVGNELWDYPVRSDYHSMLTGARNAFVARYGAKANGGWKMKLVAGSFQAYRDNTCSGMLRNVSNCGGGLERHDFIGDYLNVDNCEVLKELDAIDCHPYSFQKNTLTWTHPEDPNSEAWQIRNLAAWRDANKNTTTGVLANTRLWASEYGFDSYSLGENTQAAYLVRGLLLHSRFHFEKIFFYNAFDKVRPNSPYYNGLYNSSGFWKMGAHPSNANVPSPLIQHGATPKPAWHAMLDFKTRFGEHVFYKVLNEDDDLYAYLLAKPDGSDPYILFWSPKASNDNNALANIEILKNLSWAGVLNGSFRVESGSAQYIALSTGTPTVFTATNSNDCGNAQLISVRRMPAFLKLVPCSACDQPLLPGSIAVSGPNTGSAPFLPGTLSSVANATGTPGQLLEYQWQYSTNGINFLNIAGAQDSYFISNALSVTTWFRRAAKYANCPQTYYSNTLKIEVVDPVGNSGCPELLALSKVNNPNLSCNANNDYFYEVQLGNIFQNDEIWISGLPSNGLNMQMSVLNGQNFNTATFNANVVYINQSSFKWKVFAANGPQQTLRIAYCWANYPPNVSATVATAACSGETMTCVQNRPEDLAGERTDAQVPATAGEALRANPNPGSAGFTLSYQGPAWPEACVSVTNATGQLIYNQKLEELPAQGSWQMDTQAWSNGVYFVQLQTAQGAQHLVWVKIW